jgi:hypothetical protein
MIRSNMITCTIGILGMALSNAGCLSSDDDPTGEPGADTASSAVTVCRQVEHFDYNLGGSTYHWDVTTEFGTGRQFVDERRVGGGFYRQYRVSPIWSLCPGPNEIVELTSGRITLVGSHNCLPDGREEYHGSDYQRLLVPLSPRFTYSCDP